ncbi:class I SAM-dependent methyltransferase [Labrys wisconsinensis]|uniref:Nicotinamide N-methyase n=1 Tax=Labrys wisconsinensis TaxID=425677 RepID=A0ABU0JE93_9HYPH|nr:50S ribosomal protein L11 methyltransferase [Labrys wisconsinensis]MDQ0472595.1 putative nicotinamide N-methyase [Labrys wisconsinensis]
MIPDPHAFIRANTRLLPVPHAPEIVLHVADEVTPLWHRTEEELGALGLPPPFWAFAWAGGQALARYVLDHPQTVAGKRVLDFASGSGLVAIAAMKAGAAAVVAAEIDRFAIAAIGLNAAANGVAVAAAADNVLGRFDIEADVVLAGDIFYDREIAAEVMAWLQGWQGRGAAVLIGDPGRTYLPKDRLDCLASYEVPVSRELEDLEIKRSSVWRLRPETSA